MRNSHDEIVRVELRCLLRSRLGARRVTVDRDAGRGQSSLRAAFENPASTAPRICFRESPGTRAAGTRHERWRFAIRDATLNTMDEPKRLADPAFEPTDEDLIGLSKRAFAHVPRAREESLRKMRDQIAAARKSALDRLKTRWPGLMAAD